MTAIAGHLQGALRRTGAWTTRSAFGDREHQLKAQRLSFGPRNEAADTFARNRRSAPNRHKDTCCAQAVAARAVTAVLEIRVLQAPHIAESGTRR